MSPIVVLLIIVAVAVVAFAAVAVVGYFQSGAAQHKRELRTTRYQLALANAGLRAIVNGAGNPVFEAQDALDKIEEVQRNELKELHD